MRTRARQLLILALGVGIAGDLLLRGGEWRAGFTLLILLTGGCAVMIGGHGQRERNLLLGGFMLASLGFVFRDAEPLFAMDILSVLCMAALAIWHGTGKSVTDLTVVDSIRALVLAPLVTAFGGFGALGALRGDPSSATPADSGRTRAIAIGLVLAIPPLLIVGLLLGSSDYLFGSFLQTVVEFVMTDAIQHVFVVALLGWFAAGWLRGTVGDERDIRVMAVGSPHAPFLTVGIALYGLVALLALYVGVQARALFGGAEYLMTTAGLTVAEYARRGFHELVFASGIVLGTLVAAEWVLGPGDTEGRARHRAVGAVLVGLVLALLVSAATRMGLYVREFGLSVDRMMAMNIMAWVVVALTTFAFTTLRARPQRFAPVLFLATIGWVSAVNLVGIEGVVVRTNIARAARGEEFDAKYHAALSADGLAAMLVHADELPPAACTALAAALQTQWQQRLATRDSNGSDWRSLDLPLMRATAWYDAGALTPCARTD